MYSGKLIGNELETDWIESQCGELSWLWQGMVNDEQFA
jgi:hypothetical protein